MNQELMDKAQQFCAAIGMDELPMGMRFTDEEPEGGVAPKPGSMPTREKEQAGQVNWGEVFGNFTCVMGCVWRARKKRVPAYVSAEHFGCPGAAFWMGFTKPQVEAIVHYVSTGTPGGEGELYCNSPDELRRVFGDIDPVPAPAKYCELRPLELLDDKQPEWVVFFARPECMSALHQLAFFVTSDPEVVASPWSSGCGSIAAWPMRYKAMGLERAVLGGWDISARKFYKTDELTFTVPFSLFEKMLAGWQESFIGCKNWQTVMQKVERSKRAWDEA